jgi:RNA polymerase sigma-70 factor (ECF subfamily)
MVDEKELVRKILAGDLRHFDMLIKQYEKLVFHIAYRLTNNQADSEDICQDVFIKVHKHLSQFNFKSRLSTWISRIAYFTTINYLKRYRNTNTAIHTDDIGDQLTVETNPETDLVRKDVSEYLKYLIDRMPIQYRIIITLFHLEEFSYKEIEEITGLPEGTVKTNLFRARKLLKDKLQTYLKKETDERR